MKHFIFKFMRFIALKYSQEKVKFFLKNKTISVFGNPDILFEDRITFGHNCSINHQAYLNGMGGISVGSNVHISAGAKIISTGLETNLCIGKHITKEIVIEDNVWIGAGAIVLQGVRIKKNSIVAAGAVVNKDINENEIWAGVPAQLIKRRES